MDTPRLRHRMDPLALLWAMAFLAVSGWVTVRLGMTRLSTTVTTSDGRSIEVPVTWATVDHPFHIERAETLRRSLADGELLRWIGHHQGGYPAEFYPFGVAWLDVTVWALLFGTVMMPAVHKIVIILIFLSPVVAYIGLSRVDRVPLGVAFFAFAVHLAVPGFWWYGGYRELVEWGLVTNVTASYAAFIALMALLSYAATGNRWALAVAVGACVFAFGSNTRSILALSCIALGVILALAPQAKRIVPLAFILQRVGVVACLSALITAPLWMNQIRFRALYTFVRYEWYDGLGEYWRASLEAVSTPIAMLTGVGLVVGLVPASRVGTRAVAVTLCLYAGLTAVLSVGGDAGGLISQLEPTRMMPFQRVLMIYLAGVGIWWIVDAVNRRRVPYLNDATLAAGAVLVLIVIVIRPPTAIAAEDRGLFDVTTTDTPIYAEFLDAVRLADTVATEGTALYIVGSQLGWHEQLWAPQVSDRPLRYDNWLWNWHPWHTAPGYDYQIGHAYTPATLQETFGRNYLDLHGIGAIVVSGDIGTSAALASPALSPVPGYSDRHSVFIVEDAVGVVEYVNGEVLATVVDRHEISADLSGEGGVVTVSITWHPRWIAMVNEQLVAVNRTEAGYLAIMVPIGEAEVRLQYAVDRWDWLARMASAIGVFVTALALGISGDRWRRLRHQRRRLRD